MARPVKYVVHGNEYRMFGGKRYYFHSAQMTKRDSEKVARQLRTSGYSVRLASGGTTGHTVWVRKQK